MDIGDAIDLVLDRSDDVGVAMAETGDRGAARRVEVTLSFGIDDVDPFAARHRRVSAGQTPVKQMGH